MGKIEGMGDSENDRKPHGEERIERPQGQSGDKELQRDPHEYVHDAEEKERTKAVKGSGGTPPLLLPRRINRLSRGAFRGIDHDHLSVLYLNDHLAIVQRIAMLVKLESFHGKVQIQLC